jgi:hypothetical protein
MDKTSTGFWLERKHQSQLCNVGWTDIDGAILALPCGAFLQQLFFWNCLLGRCGNNELYLADLSNITKLIVCDIPFNVAGFR